MTPPGEMFSAPPLEKEDLLRQSEILAMRQIADTMASMRVTQEAMVKAIQETRSKVDDMLGRMILLEERNRQLERLRDDLGEVDGRVTALERASEREAGARSVWKTLADKAPWLLPMISAVAAAVGVKALDHPH